MAAEPLTDDEKQQSDEWQKLIMGPGKLYLNLVQVSCMPVADKLDFFRPSQVNGR